MRTPLRVLVVTNMYPVAGQPAFGSFVASQVRSLQRIGVEADVFFIDGRSSRTNYLRATAEVRRRVAASAYDLVHAHYGLTGWVARVQFVLPLVVSFCGDDLLGTPAAGGGRTALSMAFVATSHLLEPVCDEIIVKSEQMRRRLFLRRSRERAHLIPNGVDLDMFVRMPRDEALRRVGLRGDRRYVLFPHTPDEVRKRIDLARATVDLLRSRRPDVELLVVHHQPPELMPAYYSASDVMILTSDWEGSPNVVKESLACELPVVSVAAGDVEERLAGLAGCRVCPRDPAALAGALEDALDLPRSPELRAAVQPLSAERVAHRVLAVYQSALARRQKAPAFHADT